MKTAVPLQQQIIGSWSLVSFTETSMYGDISYPLGQDAKGSICYLATGQVSVHIMDIHRTATIDAALYTNRLLKYTDLSYLAYSGSFHVDEKRKIMTHDVAISIYPDWVGGQQVRLIELEADQLLLSSTGLAEPEKPHFKLLWKRDRIS